LVVLPSTYEGLPLIVLEAMASAKPIVASRVGGVPEAIEDYKNGILFESGDVSAMSKDILFLLQNDSIRARMGARGRIMAQQRFDWKIIAQQYVKEFEALT
jgi:glycosyltransferase involved in cell wall biosynthesis